MAKRYLVTGGLGFLGSALVRALVKAGHTVRTLDNLSRGAGHRLGDVSRDVESITGDIRDAEAVARAIRGMDAVCHLAYVNGTEYFYSRPAEVLDVGVRGMLNVLDGCTQAGVGELVLASSSEVYQTPPAVPTDESVPLSVPDPLNPRYSYGGGKIISELMALHYGRRDFQRVLIFRPHNVYGPDMGWQHVIPQFAERMALLRTPASGPAPFEIQGSGEQSRSFIYIDDFTDGLMRVIEKGENQGIYHIGTMEEITMRELALKVARVLGVDITVVPGREAPGGTNRRCPDITRLRGLGFEPRHPLDAGLEPTVRWYAARAADRAAAPKPS
jgi:nucleoside-diphosphate-sugar epimerase